MYDKLLIRLSGDLYSFTLPDPLFRKYVEIMVQVESGEIGALTGGLARMDVHGRLRDWWTEEMPHVPVEAFEKALEKAVEYALPECRRLLTLWGRFQEGGTS